MFISSYIDKQYWFDILMYLLGWGILLGNFLFFNKKLWKKY
jgi:hypothetical protein